MNDYADFPWAFVLFCVGFVSAFFGGLFIGLRREPDDYERGYSDGYEHGYEHGYQHGFNNRRSWRDRPIQ